MDRELFRLFALFAVLVVILLPAVFFEDAYYLITGESFHAAKGGAINYIELRYTIETTPNWHGIYGLILPFWGAEPPITFNGSAGNITRHDIKSNITAGYVMISNSSSPPAISALVPGNISILDSITGDDVDSASSTFTTLREFRFNDTVISNVPSTNMTTVYPQEGVYELYFLQDNESFIIAAPIELHMIGYNGEIADYQAMVPQGNQSANLTYHIHLIMNYTAPPSVPTQPTAGAGGAGGGAAAVTVSAARAVSANKTIMFEGPFQLRNNTAFWDAVQYIWAQPAVNEALDAIMGYSRSVKGNFSGTIFIYSGGSASVLIAAVKYAGEKLSNVVLWNRLPSYFIDESLTVNAPMSQIRKVCANERAFVYGTISTGDEILIVYRAGMETNGSVINDTVFEVYAEPAKEIPVYAVCEEGSTKCEGNEVMECINGLWVSSRICPQGCEAEKCIERAEGPDYISLILLFIVWLITVLILAVGSLIYRRVRRGLIKGRCVKGLGKF